MVLHEFPVAESQAETLRPWIAGPHPAPAAPRPAATVLLLRPGVHEPLEVFLMRRRSTMAFAARMHVFPGGGMDRRDAEGDIPWAGPSPQEWAEWLGCPVTTATAIVCAAVRELFEECGVLLAGPASSGAGSGSDGGALVADVSGPEWEAERTRLLDRSQSLSELVRRRGLAVRSDLLRPWAHWLTPEFEPRRFDTWFFLAALPAEQQARHIAEEADLTMWAGVDAVVRAYRAGELALMFPTRSVLEDLQDAVRTAEAGVEPIRAVLESPRTLRRVMPWVVATSDGGVRLLVDLDGRGDGRPHEAVSGSWP